MDTRVKRLLSVLLIALIVVLAISMRLRAPAPTTDAAQRAQTVAEARDVGDPSLIVATVGDQPISQRDLAEWRAIVATNLDYMESEIASGAPTSGNLAAIRDLIRSYDPAVVALAGVVADRATYQYALDQGYHVSDEEVAARTARDRELFSTNPSPEAKEMMDALTAGVGEETYWADIYPVTIRRQLTMERFWMAQPDSPSSLQEERQRQNRVTRTALQTVPITIINPDAAGGVTLDEVRRYLDAYMTLTDQ